LTSEGLIIEVHKKLLIRLEAQSLQR